MTELRDRVAIVTGAAGGAGRAVVAELAAGGARLALLGTRLERLEALARELDLPSERYLALPSDLRDAEAASRAVDAVVERFGRLDIVVHLVGGWTGGPNSIDTPESEFTTMLEQHFWTTIRVVRAVVPRLTAAGWGRIIAVSSPVATDPRPGQAAYAVGKAAEETLLRTLAHEIAGSGVTVNVLQVKTIDAAHQRASAPSPQNASWTTPEEIASAVRYLCSDAARVINGARLPLFGGA